MPLAPLQKRAIAASMSRKAILRLAKIVAVVTLNWASYPLHLNMRRAL